MPDKKILNGKKQLQNCPKQFYWPNFEHRCVSNGNRTRNLLSRRRVLYIKGYFNGRIWLLFEIWLMLLQKQFNFFQKNRGFILPDKKIINDKKTTKTATKLSQTILLSKLWTSGKGCVSNGNRTRNLLSRRRVLYTKGYLNGRSWLLFEISLVLLQDQFNFFFF